MVAAVATANTGAALNAHVVCVATISRRRNDDSSFIRSWWRTWEFIGWWWDALLRLSPGARMRIVGGCLDSSRTGGTSGLAAGEGPVGVCEIGCGNCHARQGCCDGRCWGYRRRMPWERSRGELVICRHYRGRCNSGHWVLNVGVVGV